MEPLTAECSTLPESVSVYVNGSFIGTTTSFEYVCESSLFNSGGGTCSPYGVFPMPANLICMNQRQSVTHRFVHRLRHQRKHRLRYRHVHRSHHQRYRRFQALNVQDPRRSHRPRISFTKSPRLIRKRFRWRCTLRDRGCD